MKNDLIYNEQKLEAITAHAPTGLVEIDGKGKVIYMNKTGESLLRPILIANNTNGSNFYRLLGQIAPAITEKIKCFSAETGDIFVNELHSFQLSFAGETIERHFNFTATKIFADRFIIGFDDVTEKCQRDKAILQLVLEKTVTQGKFEIASNVLHDIGNAVVGIGSYLNRIRRILEKENGDNLKNLAAFFSAQEANLVNCFGAQKAGAIITMLNSLTEAQNDNQEEIRKSVKEQLNIITHIQEILTIQRQYLSGNETQENQSTNLRGIVKDCISMLLASFEKRGITVSLDIPADLPPVEGNRTRLMQVMLNIFKNSMEAIDLNASQKNIFLRAYKDNDWLILLMQDSGHGFDTVTGKQLFTRGFTTKASGTGLGLSHCRSIIESHGGTIDISSDGFGKGALITIKFKIEAGEQPGG